MRRYNQGYILDEYLVQALDEVQNDTHTSDNEITLISGLMYDAIC